MPLIQGGPPEWIWELTADPLKWEIVPSRRPSDGETVHELKVKCGLGIMRLQFFTDEELERLGSAIRAPRSRRMLLRNEPSRQQPLGADRQKRGQSPRLMSCETSRCQ